MGSSVTWKIIKVAAIVGMVSLIVIFLTGCSITQQDEDPFMVTCEALCTNAEECTLTVDGTGRAVFETKTETKK